MLTATSGNSVNLEMKFPFYHVDLWHRDDFTLLKHAPLLLTVIIETPQFFISGMSLCAMLDFSWTPVRILTVRGTSRTYREKNVFIQPLTEGCVSFILSSSLHPKIVTAHGCPSLSQDLIKFFFPLLPNAFRGGIGFFPQILCLKYKASWDSCFLWLGAI